MLTNRRTSFTNLEFPNAFEDPQWASWDAIPNKTLVSSAVSNLVEYVVPDGASGWYAMKVVSSTKNYDGNGVESWGYTYLHEGSVVSLWNNALSMNEYLGAHGKSSYYNQGAETGIICAFKKTSSLGADNYGVYPTAAPIKVYSGLTMYKKWTLTDLSGRQTVRYSKGSTFSRTVPAYVLIDGVPCLSFEHPTKIWGESISEWMRITGGEEEDFDGIYLGPAPLNLVSQPTQQMPDFQTTNAFMVSAGLLIGESSDTYADGGGAALGSSNYNVGPTLVFGMPSTTNGDGGVAFFDFTRGIAEDNERISHPAWADTTPGAYLYKITEPGHDYTEPYAQKFTAPEALTDCTFRFLVNGVEYEFPEDWPDANKQKAFTGEYVTYIPNVHIGDTLQVIANYFDGSSAGGVYVISMHSLVYGVFLSKYEFLYTDAGGYFLTIPAGTYLAYLHGAGGAGGEAGGATNFAAGEGGAGATGDLVTTNFTLPEEMQIYIYVGEKGYTYAYNGNGGAGGSASYSNIGGNGGGGGRPSLLVIEYALTEEYFYANGGGGGGGGGGSAHGHASHMRYSGPGGGGGGGGFYRVANHMIESVPGQNAVDGNGVQGNITDFPLLKSGNSGAGGDDGAYYAGKPGAYGGGASGAAGTRGKQNTDWTYSGGGGGGAGGSADAGGGHGGYGQEGRSAGQNGTNYHSLPTKSINWLGQEVLSGWGIGGIPNMNGSDGWVYIARVEDVIDTMNCGSITEAATTLNMGLITDAVVDTIACGNII